MTAALLSHLSLIKLSGAASSGRRRSCRLCERALVLYPTRVSPDQGLCSCRSLFSQESASAKPLLCLSRLAWHSCLPATWS